MTVADFPQDSNRSQLQMMVSAISRLGGVLADLADQPDLTAAAQRLLDTACDLEISPGVTLQWFAVRLELPNR